MRPRATSASPRRSFFRLLAAKTMRPWSKKRVLTVLAGLHLEVAAAPRAGEGAERLGDGGGAEIGEHAAPWIPQPHARCTPGGKPCDSGHLGTSRSQSEGAA